MANAVEAEAALRRAVAAAAAPLADEEGDYGALLGWIGDARVVLLGEASHGTHEFYRARAEITKRLITELGFAAVAIEGDFPDSERVDRFVRGADGDPDAVDALAGFRRFPQWMWRNDVVLDFVGWLRAHNEARGAARAGFYGLDLYSLYGSMVAVLDYLRRVDPEAAERARRRYACFDHFGEDSQAYGYATSLGVAEPCEEQVIAQLIELRRLGQERPAGRRADRAFFSAEQNARLVTNAERYYRSMFRGRASSWNLRDQHMAETLESVLAHLRSRGEPDKVVVWAHNSHLGDARATDMADRGELNVGQLVRERHGREAFLVGFTTSTGTVTAASDWDAPAERKRVRPPLPGSYESLFHRAGLPRFQLLLRDVSGELAALRQARLERAIGVIYRPETERLSHYFHARLPEQFDAVLHFDETRAVEPLERAPGEESGELPETYPVAV